jgi:hypothetical protein
MDQTNHIPPVATPPPPPPPSAVLLRATDLPIHPYHPLLSAQDLPIKGPCLEPFKRSSLFGFPSFFHTLTAGFSGNTPIHTYPPFKFTPAPQNAQSASSASDESSVHGYLPWRPTPGPKREHVPTTIDDSPSPLSSPSPSPAPLRHSPRRSSSIAGPSQLLQITKVRIGRPKGAGRSKITNMVDWDPSLLKAVQVCLQFKC